MQARIWVALLTLALPAALIAVTVWRFGSNPLSLLTLLAVLIAGSMYQLSYAESF